MTFWRIFRFELAHHARRRSTWLYFGVVMALAIQITNESFVPSARSGGHFFNAPIVIAAITAMATMFGLLIAAAVAGEAATRDMQTRMEPLLYTTPLRKSTYLGGRYLAALTRNALLLAAVPLALMLDRRRNRSQSSSDRFTWRAISRRMDSSLCRTRSYPRPSCSPLPH